MSSPILSSPASCADAPATQVDGLYRDHRPWLFGWLRRKLGCAHRAEDLAQDVFVRVIQGRKTVRAGEARALLTTIAKGLVIDHQRHAALEHAYLAYLADLPEAHAPSPETQAEQMQALMQRPPARQPSAQGAFGLPAVAAGRPDLSRNRPEAGRVAQFRAAVHGARHVGLLCRAS